MQRLKNVNYSIVLSVAAAILIKECHHKDFRSRIASLNLKQILKADRFLTSHKTSDTYFFEMLILELNYVKVALHGVVVLLLLLPWLLLLQWLVCCRTCFAVIRTRQSNT